LTRQPKDQSLASLFVFGLGYTGSRLAHAVRARGWSVAGTGRIGITFDDVIAVRSGVATATHVVSTIPPDAEGDPVLRHYADDLRGRWLGYLSSTGVYGDADGAWVDESAPIRGRRANRNAADAAWLGLGASVFRLPGIYGPDRSALDRVREGKAHRVDLPEQVFSRVHVDDIVSAVIAGFDAPAGAYNIADHYPCDQNRVIEAAANILGVEAPPFVALENLSAMARAFYAENRRVANGKAKRVLRWSPAYPDFAAGLFALSAMSSPTSATTPPAADRSDQR